jgi:hypothetical protein
MSSFTSLDESGAAASSTSASSAVSSTTAPAGGGDHDVAKKAGPKESGKSEISGAVFNLANAVRAGLQCSGRSRAKMARSPAPRRNSRALTPPHTPR